jgi:hypothetical protein
MVDCDVDLAVTFIDGQLDTMNGRSLVATSEVVDILLDLRALLVTIDLIGRPHV